MKIRDYISGLKRSIFSRSKRSENHIKTSKESITPMHDNTSVETSIELDSQPKHSNNVTASEDFVELCQQSAKLIKMYDMMAKQMPDGETKDAIEDYTNQLILAMLNCSGCKPINHDATFDSRRHTPVPFDMVDDGTPIQSFLRPGITIGEKTIITAKVKI